MKFRVERDAFADAVAYAARVVPTRPTVPVLRGVRLRLSADSLTVAAFDYVVSAEASVPVDGAAEGGEALVSGRLLTDICRTLPARPVDVEVEGTRALLSCGSARFSLPLLPVEEYPQLPVSPQSSGTVEADVFVSAVSAVGVAAGREDALPAFTGVKVDVEGSRMTMAATDRYRLAVRELSWQPEDNRLSTSALIPARTLLEVARSAGSGQVAVSLPAQDGEGIVGFEVAGRRTTTRLLDGAFPAYRPLLPTQSAIVTVVEVAALQEAVRRVALAADRGTAVRCRFGPDGIDLEATGDEAEARESVPVREHTGDPLEVAFNPTYLLDGLGVLGSEAARLAFNDARQPTLMSPVGDGADLQYLLMPVLLNR